ncbi:dihydroneopterin aldolase [Roseicyclus sp. F158]|uniref:dihydroneopterin aldolase n=1 Tax=Tropicimonas omnivorans TaxID=3075590 RepID=A0ABU3DGD7_9RHOB|nr:dihydroneopterin aldolase [Roseicyclus sp. F158]MDT0682618.1 dihydroneopterin aldolase [Roseicyclus sp. F158]
MTDPDLSAAFGHPEDRATASAARPRDRISLRDHVLNVEIGAFQEERGSQQRLRFDIVCEVSGTGAPAHDDVDRILSYDTLVDAVDAALAEERLNLLETLAERIAGLLLQEPRAERVFVRIEKLDRGPYALGVEIVRSAGPERERGLAAPDMPRPVVAHLSNDAIADPRLPQWLDTLEEGGAPVVLTVTLPETPAPVAGASMPQRRIDLLALDQNAWVLAARDPRCLVVGSRTEIEHAIRQGRMLVWAPSKIVLDSPERPDAGPREPERLAAFLADTLGATHRVGIGADMPGGTRLETEAR